MNLTNEDINMLLEALDAWDREPSHGAMIGEVFQAMLSPKNPNFKAEFEQRREEDKVKERARKEQSIKLRAKLIDMRPSIVQQMRN